MTTTNDSIKEKVLDRSKKDCDFGSFPRKKRKPRDLFRRVKMHSEWTMANLLNPLSNKDELQEYKSGENYICWPKAPDISEL